MKPIFPLTHAMDIILNSLQSAMLYRKNGIDPKKMWEPGEKGSRNEDSA